MGTQCVRLCVRGRRAKRGAVRGWGRARSEDTRARASGGRGPTEGAVGARSTIRRDGGCAASWALWSPPTGLASSERLAPSPRAALGASLRPLAMAVAPCGRQACVTSDAREERGVGGGPSGRARVMRRCLVRHGICCGVSWRVSAWPWSTPCVTVSTSLGLCEQLSSSVRAYASVPQGYGRIPTLILPQTPSAHPPWA